ncbi:hypothetical protein SSP24_70530 [Streptomyces spinoverrucosus]|uniref:Uncharacterized protein n=1 Tax=Streptomyces spinoverrucosus TaxID=284043 RepID=A0A4Y3VT29_9ACTN|nr:hypothetical protein SSP24_70530 [Streptomyces spinoverrucosus]GHB61424.1 hypothetical protein GCM10010397_34690 [Streptomyces spinoverrucosus]
MRLILREWTSGSGRPRHKPTSRITEQRRPLTGAPAKGLGDLPAPPPTAIPELGTNKRFGYDTGGFRPSTRKGPDGRADLFRPRATGLRRGKGLP